MLWSTFYYQVPFNLFSELREGIAGSKWTFQMSTKISREEHENFKPSSEYEFLEDP